MKNDRVFILRESVVKITQLLSGKGIKVTQQGVQAYVRADHNGVPVLVNLPYLPDNATEDLINAIQGFLDHEVAHILFTNFPLMSVAMRKSKQVGFMLNALEDPRIEKEMAKRFSGSAYNLSNTGKFYLDKFVVPRIEEKARAGDANGVIEALIVPMIRAMSGQQVFKEFMAIDNKWATVAPVYERIKDLQPQIEGAESTEDCLKLAEEIGKRLSEDSEGGKGGSESKSKSSSKSVSKGAGKGKGKEAASSAGKPEKEEKTPGAGAGKPDDEDEEEKEEKGAGGGGKSDKDDEKEDEKEEAPAEKEDEKGEEEEEDPADPSDPAPEPEADPADGEDKIEAAADEEEDDGEIGEGADPSGSSPNEGDDESDLDDSAPIWAALDKDGANAFDEAMSRVISEQSAKSAVNATYLPFTKDYDVIEKLPIGTGYEPRMTKAMADKVDHMVAPLQKDLERAISARSLSTRSHGHKSGRLHAANLSRLAVGDVRVFSRKHESTSKDVAIELVVDCSGSMGGSKIHTACQAAYALSSVLERLNIKNEVIGFTTKDIGGAQKEMYEQQSKTGIRFSRAEGIYMPILKGYDERLTSNVKERFGWLPHTNILRSNVDGESVENAARRLMARREESKILIVLSDGYPAAAGSRGDLEKHLKDVVRNVSATGVKVVGIGIESDAVKTFYPKNIVLHSVEELPAAVIKELRHLLMN